MVSNPVKPTICLLWQVKFRVNTTIDQSFCIQRRLVDYGYKEFKGSKIPSANTTHPWYVPSRIQQSVINAQWEGVGTGWYYSLLGGGSGKRPSTPAIARTNLNFDNSHPSNISGDFTIPTVFNGDLDAIDINTRSQDTPSWTATGSGQLGKNQSGNLSYH